MSGVKHASENAAEALFDLLCSAKDEINLNAKVTDPSNRREYLDWVRRKCTQRLVHIVPPEDRPVAMLIMDENRELIRYIVVTPSSRRNGHARNLVSSVQRSANQLSAEARNKQAEELFAGLGFAPDGNSSSGYPIYKWRA